MSVTTGSMHRGIVVETLICSVAKMVKELDDYETGLHTPLFLMFSSTLGFFVLVYFILFYF